MKILELNKAYLDWTKDFQQDPSLQLGEYLVDRFKLDDIDLENASNEDALRLCQKHIDLNPEPAHKAEASDAEEGE